jgi:hypothetical protein
MATPQSHAQLVFQLLKVRKFPLYINQFFFQSAAHMAASGFLADSRDRVSP